jgi:hypothetical protein
MPRNSNLPSTDVLNNGHPPNIPNRQPSATDLPLAGNNFLQASYSFVFTSMKTGKPVVSELTLVVNPEEFQQTESSTANVVLTAGDVFSDTFGAGLTRIRISGTFGQRPKAGSGSGQLEALRLRKFFRQYLDEVNPITTKDFVANAGAKLQFFNPKDNEYWDIEIPGDYLTISRSKTSPFLYRYSLNFIGMTPSTQTGIYDFLQSITKTANSVPIINQNITDILTEAATRTQQIATTSTSIGLGAVFFPNQILTPLTNLNTAITNFVNGSAQVINYPLAGVDQLVANCRTMLSAIDTAYDTHIVNELAGADDGFRYDPNVDNLLATTIQNVVFITIYENIFVKNYIQSDFYNQTSVYDLNLVNVNLNNITSVIYGQVSIGDTIESLALKGMGSVSFWKTLAEFNNLVYPFIYIVDPNNPDDFQPEKTLGVGMNIAFPQFNSQSENSLILGKTTGGPNTNDFAFGEDFLLDETNDIIIDSKGEILTVVGIDNLLQAVAIKFNVMQGELITHLNFGLPNLLGYRTLSFVTSLAASALKSTILSDTRIKSVTNIQVSIQDDVLSYTCEIQPNFTSEPIVLEGTIGGNIANP